MAPNPIESDEFWLFGYGSLIWKPPPFYGMLYPKAPPAVCHSLTNAPTGQTVESLVMLQAMFADSGSQDHRGTPEAPGRVVTLIEKSFWETLHDPHPVESDRVWGTAYRIQSEKVSEVREYLDIREINGYTIHYTPFYPSDGSQTIRTLVYIGTPDNDQFMGPQDPQQLAEHIHRSVGPSGLNRDYLLNLDEALDGLSAESGDGHVKDLANRVRALEKWTDANGCPVIDEALDYKLNKVGSSTDEQEETEK